MNKMIAAMCLLLPALAGLSAQTPPLLVETNRSHLPPHRDYTRVIVPVDLNGDLHPDLVVGTGYKWSNWGSGDRLYLNDGRGGFEEVVGSPLSRHARDTRIILAGDLDQDGNADLVVVSNDQARPSQIRIHLGDGKGGLKTTAGPPVTGGTEYRCGVLGDLDGDGDLDMILGCPGTADLYFNSGKGVFTIAGQIPSVFGRYPQGFALGDLDRDGDLDLVAASGKGKSIQVWHNNGKGRLIRWTSGHYQVGSWVKILLLADMDRDGIQDLFLGIGSSTSNNSLIYRGDGKGGFLTSGNPTLPAVNPGAHCAAAGDVDGDGYTDLALGLETYSSSQIPSSLLLLNDRKGGFKESKHWPYSGNKPVNSLALVDLDLDGDQDAVLATSYLENRIFFNDGRGRFISAATYPIPKRETFAGQLLLADLDGDADLDLLAGGLRQGTLLFLNGEDGRLEDVSATHLASAASLKVNSLVLGDLDRDGDSDLVLQESTNLVFLPNDGKARFGKPQLIYTMPSRQVAMVLQAGDLDGDRDLDLFLGVSGQSRLLFNDGKGGFTDVTATHLPSFYTYTRAALFLDVDRDGDLDLVLGNYHDQNRIFLNDGKGSFSWQAPGMLPGRYDNTCSLAGGDLNRDGYPDLVVGNNSDQPNHNLVYLHGGKGKPYLPPRAIPGPPSDTSRSIPTEVVLLADLDQDGNLDLVEGRAATFRFHLGDGKGGLTPRGPAGEVSQDRGAALGDLDNDGDPDLVFCAFTDIRLFRNTARQLHSPRRARPGESLNLVGHAVDRAGKSSRTILPLMGLGTGWTQLPPLGLLRLDPTRAIFPLPPAGTRPATGRAEWHLPLPLSPAIVGIPLPFQALAQDGHHGWRFTNLSLQTICSF